MTISNRIKAYYGSKKGLANLILHTVIWRLSKSAQHTTNLKHISRLVFVCSGNICRSSVGAVIADELGLNTTSFGLDTTDNKQADPRMIKIAKHFGHNLEKHRTTSVKSFTPKEGDLYLAMDLHQCKQIKNIFGQNAAVSLLGLWSKPRRPYIHDPYGCEEPYFYTCVKHIEAAVKQLHIEIDCSCRKETFE